MAKTKRSDVKAEMAVVNVSMTRGIDGATHALNLQSLPQSGPVGPGTVMGNLVVYVEDAEHYSPGDKVTLTIHG